MHKDSQVANIESALARRATRVIAVTSGKGGVGKTNVAVNLAVSLAKAQRRVMLFDADLGLANVDVLLGLQPRFNLAHVISGEADLDCTIIEGPAGLRIVPASSGNLSLLDLDARSQASIVQSFSELVSPPEFLVVDTAAGISDSVARFTQAAHHAIVVLCDEPSSLTDSYALMKVFSREYGITHFQVVTNMTGGIAEGRRLFEKINGVCSRFLDVVLRHAGNIPQDTYLKLAVQEQRAVVDAYPRSWSGKSFARLAEAMSRLPERRQSKGAIEFFFERLVTEPPKQMEAAS